MIKSTSSVFVSILALSTALIYIPLTSHAKETATINLEPQSPWATTMVEAARPEDGYCVLARKYNKGMVLTLGQSALDEYSLALDFQGKKLNLDKSYKVNLQPAAGQLRAYEVMPASAQAIVVRLGYDESFLQALEESSQLKADVDGENYSFKVSDLAKGKRDLKKCIASLKGDDAVGTPPQFVAEKIKNEDIIDTSKLVEIPVSGPVVVAANEVTPAIVKKPIQMARVDSKATIVTPEPVILSEKELVELPQTKVEKALPQKIVIEQKVSKVDIPDVEMEEAKQTIRVSQVSSLTKDMSERPKQISAQNKKYGSQVVKSLAVPKIVKDTKIPAKIKTTKIEDIKHAEITEVLKDEKKFPKPFSNDSVDSVDKAPRPPQGFAEKEVKEVPVFMPKKAEIEKQAKLVNQEQHLKKQQQQLVDKRSEENNLELTKVRDDLNELEKENRALYLEARKARGAIDTAVVATSNEALKKMRTYEKKLEAAQADNLELSKEIEEMRRIQEDVQVSAAGGDVTAEKSVHRYNEAEREIKRLGLLLEQQRMAHRNEKTELENMLFDPAVTDEAQRRKLVDLESKLENAEKRFQFESKKANHIDLVSHQKLQELEQELNIAKKKEKKLKLEEQKVKIEAQRIAAAEVKFQAMAEKEKALKEKEKRLLEQSQKVAQEQALAQARERALAEAKRVAAAEAKLEEVRRKELELAKSEKALKAQTRAMAVAEARLAEVTKKELAIKVAEKRLNEKVKNIEAYSRERVATAPSMAVTSALASAPKALTPSAQSIRSNTAIQKPSFGQGNLKQLLDNAGISSVSAIRQQAENQFYWKAAGMTGRAKIAPKGGSLTQFAHSYIATEKKNCRGDFASLPARVPGGKQGYELACVSVNGGTSSSVVFSQQGNSLMAIAHETTMDNMDAAIDARDKVAKNL